MRTVNIFPATVHKQLLWPCGLTHNTSPDWSIESHAKMSQSRLVLQCFHHGFRPVNVCEYAVIYGGNTQTGSFFFLIAACENKDSSVYSNNYLESQANTRRGVEENAECVTDQSAWCFVHRRLLHAVTCVWLADVCFVWPGSQLAAPLHDLSNTFRAHR